MRNKNFEILAPAGDLEILKAVINSGADAVYIGGKAYGARAFANNFDEESLLHALDYAHLHERKVYLTVNTLIKNDEMDMLYDYLLPYYKEGLDAVIVQDLGAIARIHELFPNLDIHTSTQMTVTGVDGVKLLKQFGITRVVMAREMSLDEMKHIHDETGMELEAFVHGALCYSYSGQCLFSSMLGGRSGNRGRCAQPCRLPYTVNGKKDTYILSLKDLCGIKSLNDLKDAGVYSLKIEGRMKQVGYAAGVVQMYRKYVDSMGDISKVDLAELSAYGSRCGFTDKYFYMHNAPDMVTYEKPNFTSTKEATLQNEEKIPIFGKLKLKLGENGEFLVSYNDISVKSTSDIVSEAKNAPIDEAAAVARMRKTGDTPFELKDIACDIDDGIFIPNGALNKLRRDALDELQIKLLSSYKRPTPDLKDSIEHNGFDGFDKFDENKKRVICSVLNKKQLDVLTNYVMFTDFYLDSSMFDRNSVYHNIQLKNVINEIKKSGKNVWLVLPTIFRKETSDYFYSIKKEILNIGFEGFVAKNYEEIYFVKNNFPDAKLAIDHNLYTYNDIAKEAFFSFGIDYDTVPLELNSKETASRDNKKSQMIVYGYYPLMTTAGCINKNINGCDKQPKLLYIKDRYDKNFPVLNNCNDCYNTIYNSVPTVLTGELEKIASYGINSIIYSFTIENEKQIKQVMSGRIKEHTNGHFKRGVQ